MCQDTLKAIKTKCLECFKLFQTVSRLFKFYKFCFFTRCSWYHIQHGSEAVFVLPGPRTRVLGPVLAIEAVSPDDSGTYKCTASNSGGDANAELQLVVSTPLQVEVTPSVQTVNMGGMAEFRCSVPMSHGSGLHLLSWYKNGRVFPGRPNGDTLIISSVTRSDRGMYQCIVRRSEGETAQSAAELKLGGKIFFF